MEPERPDPDVLLARIREQESRRERGRLKVFFGGCAGVGKTYAMLEAARARQGEGVDVVVGWVETHGRADTEALLDGLERLRPRELSYRGVVLREFDLDAALERRPALLLVDELAHTNAHGSRHAKRHHDVSELLAAGIDVFTTLNVQHVESLTDVVAQITGVQVRETVPDRVLEEADEIELVDLPPEELLQRLREGKVYLAEQAGAAASNFFRKGNLIALRELALRRVAERVDAQMLRYRSEHAIKAPWPTAERLLVLVAPSPYATRLVRSTRRLAGALKAEWIALHVETPDEAGLPAADCEQLRRTLTQAARLGAEVVDLAGEDVVAEALAYARSRNVTKIVVGKPPGAAPVRWPRRSLGDRLLRGSGGIDVYVISSEPTGTPPVVARDQRRPVGHRAWAWTAATVVACTVAAWLMHGRFDLANLVMVYLVGVMVVATRFDRVHAIAASVLSVAAFDYFFVPPRMTFAVADTQYVVTFAVMLAAALLMSGMTSRIRRQAEAGRRRERRTDALFGLARSLAGAGRESEICEAAVRHTGDLLDAGAILLVRHVSGELEPRATTPGTAPLDTAEVSVARWVGDHGQPAGRGTETLPATPALLVPVAAGGGTVAVLAIRAPAPLAADQIHLVEAFAGQIAVALERSRLAAEAHEATLQVEAERFRNDLLSTVSHDVRTPLAAIAGAASSLLEAGVPASARDELVRTIYEESRRLDRLLADILQVTRLESGAVRLEKEWQPLEEAVGAALSRVEERLGGRRVSVDLPVDLPLVPVDGLLLEQVFFNLLENAAKHTPSGSSVSIRAWSEPGFVVAEVADRGPGLPSGSEGKVFDKFARIDGRGVAGVGLGLTICRGIVAAHGGAIWAENRPDGGVAFRFRLPLEGAPPAGLPAGEEGEPGAAEQ
ncbi:MAG: sensor histidine kinase KdpD [Acidobacteria bacterium]|nr:sensor histidine kinase KdpD [Acidobacteriota bacterium]